MGYFSPIAPALANPKPDKSMGPSARCPLQFRLLSLGNKLPDRSPLNTPFRFGVSVVNAFNPTYGQPRPRRAELVPSGEGLIDSIADAITVAIAAARAKGQSLEDLTAEVLADDNLLDGESRRWLSDVVARTWEQLH
ncbi:MAG: hypothetical protein BJG00_001360 [Limnothrix sp. CACIAM 69d]|nr:MAG: hypothetical protein BJG00_001360 [Limnothrix sp. CACIAM 69d]